MRSYRIHRIFLLATLALDLAVICGSFFLAWWVRFHSGLIGFTPPAPPLGAYLRFLPLSVLVWMLALNYAGLYQRRWSVVGSGDPGRILRAVVMAAVFIFAAGFLYRGFSYSRLVLGIMGGTNLAALVLVRGFLRRVQLVVRRRGVGVLRVIVAGDGEEARGLAATLKRHPGYGFRLAGFVGRRSPHLLPNLGPSSRLGEAVSRSGADAVIIAPAPDVPRGAVADLAARCARAGTECMMLADMFGASASRLRIEDLFGMPLLAVQPHPLSRWRNRIVKRLFDLAVSSLALLFLAPLLLVVAVLVKLDSPGPVFYRQERVGRGGRRFAMIKFRSMRADAERSTGPVWAVKDDPRRTRTGSFLRRTSIDELPQIFNVLGGSMSIVGPRPERPHFVEKFGREVRRYTERHEVKPGITGWSQVNGLRGNTPVEERTKYDLFYVENWSLGLDVRIVLRTGFELFHHREAY